LLHNREEGNNSEDIKGNKPMSEMKKIKPENKKKKVKTRWKPPDFG
jgi:hypothetical protein